MGDGTSAYPLGYYQQVLLAFREFVDDEEYEEGKRRWGEALLKYCLGGKGGKKNDEEFQRFK